MSVLPYQNLFWLLRWFVVLAPVNDILFHYSQLHLVQIYYQDMMEIVLTMMVCVVLI